MAEKIMTEEERVKQLSPEEAEYLGYDKPVNRTQEVELVRRIAALQVELGTLVTNVSMPQWLDHGIESLGVRTKDTLALEETEWAANGYVCSYNREQRLTDIGESLERLDNALQICMELYQGLK